MNRVSNEEAFLGAAGCASLCESTPPNAQNSTTFPFMSSNGRLVQKDTWCRNYNHRTGTHEWRSNGAAVTPPWTMHTGWRGLVACKIGTKGQGAEFSWCPSLPLRPQLPAQLATELRQVHEFPAAASCTQSSGRKHQYVCTICTFETQRNAVHQSHKPGRMDYDAVRQPLRGTKDARHLRRSRLRSRDPGGTEPRRRLGTSPCSAAALSTATGGQAEEESRTRSMGTSPSFRPMRRTGR